MDPSFKKSQDSIPDVADVSGLRSNLYQGRMTQEIRVSIHVQDEDRTRQISDWAIRWDAQQAALMLTCHFHSGKSFSWPLSDCRVTPTRELDKTLLVRRGSTVVSPIDKAVIYGEKYAVVHYPGNPKPYAWKLGSGVEFVPQTTMKDEAVFQYFVAVANARAELATSEVQEQIAANVVRQLRSLPACRSTALHAYCTQQPAPQAPAGPLIVGADPNLSHRANPILSQGW